MTVLFMCQAQCDNNAQYWDLETDEAKLNSAVQLFVLCHVNIFSIKKALSVTSVRTVKMDEKNVTYLFTILTNGTRDIWSKIN